MLYVVLLFVLCKDEVRLKYLWIEIFIEWFGFVIIVKVSSGFDCKWVEDNFVMFV